jgi:hypothetical protein
MNTTSSLQRPNRTKNLLPFSTSLLLPSCLSFLRHCTKPCTLRQMPAHHQSLARWAPAILLPTLALTFARPTPAWIYMWIIAASLFLSAKWLTLFPTLIAERTPPFRKLIAFVFLWPGLNANAFLFDQNQSRPTPREWFFAVTKTFLGAALLVTASRYQSTAHELLLGWTAMIGIAFLLHFGLFHIISLLWRTAGVQAPPLMRLPIAATSLARFWSGRWNTAFTDFMHQFMRPLSRVTNPRSAALAIFLISGLLHECVISIPARSGYGLPTAYFLLQALGQSIERTALGRRIDLSHGWKGWTFVALFAGLPALFLFPPAFIRNIVIPMLKAL